MKMCYIDVETTGVNPYRCAIIQLAGIIEVSGDEVELFNYNIKPHDEAQIDDKALALQGDPAQVYEDIMSYPPSDEVFQKFEALLRSRVDPYDRTDKMHFVAYNAMFDAQFIRSWFKLHGNNFFGSFFFHPPLDVMVLTAEYLKATRSQLQNFKLETVCRHVGIEVSSDILHNAYGDIRLTKKLYEKVTGDA